MLETGRLILRGWRAEDRAPFAALNADPDVMRFFPAPLTRSQSDALADEIDAQFQEHGWGPWAVERRETPGFVGFVGLMPVRDAMPFAPSVQIAWRLAREAWGQGFAGEAARAGLAFGFEHLQCDEIVSYTSPLNTRSIAVMERLGMKRDEAGDFDHPRVPEGHALRAHVLYRLTRADWWHAAMGDVV
jgi:ribosomal-protein-alanine N-acetyltransferase